MTKREKAIRQVSRLWSRGAKFRAIQAADEAKLRDDEKPEGMEAHRRGLRRELQEQL